MTTGLYERVLEVAIAAESETAAAGNVHRRLAGPIAVALAGRINAGKSTLLNALLGERLALTDATECTRMVCRYSYGPAYGAGFVEADGSVRPTGFLRDEDGLHIAGVDAQVAQTLAVTVPNSVLRTTTFIDTPGLGTEDAGRAAATAAALGVDRGAEAEADAVVYLLRHAHRTDVDTLEALRDRWAGNGSAFNVIAVLSRADEIGGGRLDAMQAAAEVADRYEADGRLRGLATVVVPVSGLLAETGGTLREEEFQWLKLLASGATAEVDRLLMAASLLLGAEDSVLSSEVRRRVLARFGLFGLRVAVAGLRDGSVASSSDLARMLVRISGLESLRAVLSQQFGRRARDLQAITALEALGRIGRSLQPAPSWLARAEAIAASSSEVAEMMALQAATDGLLEFDDAEVRRLTLLLAGPNPAARLGLPQVAPASRLVEAALREINEWRQRGADPLANRLTTQVCETAARAAERIYAELAQTG